MTRRLITGLTVIVLIAGICSAQQAPPPESIMPEEYDPAEFPLWAHDLRRFEVVAVGTYPITFMLTSLVYDFTVYAVNDFDSDYSMGSQRDGGDIAIIAGTAAGVSLTIAVADLIINLSRRNRADVPDEP